jgi:prolyl-tRNA synthetase
MAKQTQEGLTVKKEDNFTEWFTQLMLKAEVADYSSVSGCIVYRPLGYALWEKIKEECDKEFKKLGMKNTYFPLFIPESSFEKEGDFVEGFAPEVAWVTHGGKTKLGEKLAVRPTSEAIMYESYSKWIRSWRDLPLMINQWNNVVRWEFNNPVPFFRGREFLWNEAHTCFATEKEAIENGRKVMKAYDKVTKDFMAVPAIYGRKTDSEKFAGGVFSEKNHTYLPNGRVLEGTCFHHDGQNFSKAYDIKFQDKDGKENFVFQNTHAISTRMLGGMLALHSDNNGLVLPPKMAPNQIVIVPLLFKGKEEKVLEKAKELMSDLKKFNPLLDDREGVSAGWKFNEWELKGVPIRIEIGPKDLENKSVVLKVRIEDEKRTVSFKSLKTQIPKLLDDMQDKLFKDASMLLYNNLTETEDKNELADLIKDKKVVAVPFCDSVACEEQTKADLGGAKALWIDENKSAKGLKCVCCGGEAKRWVFFGRTY